MMSTSVATIYYILDTTERKKKKKGSIYKSKDCEILPGPSVRGFALCYS